MQYLHPPSSFVKITRGHRRYHSHACPHPLFCCITLINRKHESLLLDCSLSMLISRVLQPFHVAWPRTKLATKALGRLATVASIQTISTTPKTITAIPAMAILASGNPIANPTTTMVIQTTMLLGFLRPSPASPSNSRRCLMACLCSRSLA